MKRLQGTETSPGAQIETAFRITASNIWNINLIRLWMQICCTKNITGISQNAFPPEEYESNINSALFSVFRCLLTSEDNVWVTTLPQVVLSFFLLFGPVQVANRFIRCHQKKRCLLLLIKWLDDNYVWANYVRPFTLHIAAYWLMQL